MPSFLRYEILTQAIWILASVILISAYLFKCDKKTKVIHSGASLIWAVHYIMLWAYVWAFVNGAWTARNLISLKVEKNKKLTKIFAVIFSFLYIWFWIYLYKDPYSLLVIASSLIWTTAIFFLKWIRFRLAMLFTIFLWLIYNTHNFSIGGLICDVFFIIANSITIFRLYVDWKKA